MRARWPPAACVLACAAILGVSAYFQFTTVLNCDVAWEVYAAQQLLRGARLYQDLLEYQPPLIHWWFIVPVLLGRILHLPAESVTHVLNYAILIASLALCWRILAASDAPPRARRVTVLLAAAFALAPGADFGQREHLMVVLAMPYWLVTIAAVRGLPVPHRLRVVSGLLAGVAFVLKPQFLLLWLGTEAYVAFQLRWRGLKRTEARFVFVPLLLYGATLPFWIKPYLAMMQVVRQAYPAYDAGLAYVLRQVPLPEWCAVAVLAVLATTVCRDAALRFGLVWLSLLAIVLAVLQHKAWTYHLLPARVLVLIAFGVVLLDILEWLASAWKPFADAVPVCLVVALAYYASHYAAPYILAEKRASPGAFEFADEVRRRAGDEPVAVLSSSMYHAFPMVNYAKLRLATRMPFLWPFPEIARRQRAAGPSPGPAGASGATLESYLLDTLVEDLTKAKPALVIVDVSPIRQGFGPTGWGEANFDYVEWLARDARFAKLWAQYAFVETYTHRGAGWRFAFYARKH